jgi:hypothetical protein
VTTPYFFGGPRVPLPAAPVPSGAAMLLQTDPPDRSSTTGVDDDATYPNDQRQWSRLIRTIENIGTENAWSEHVSPGWEVDPFNNGFCQPLPVLIQ